MGKNHYVLYKKLRSVPKWGVPSATSSQSIPFPCVHIHTHCGPSIADARISEVVLYTSLILKTGSCFHTIIIILP